MREIIEKVASEKLMERPIIKSYSYRVLQNNHVYAFS
jgi:hypothetical protein